MSLLSVPHAMSVGGDATCACLSSKMGYATIHQGLSDTTYLNGRSIRKKRMGSVADIPPIHECPVNPRHAVQDEVAPFAGMR